MNPSTTRRWHVFFRALGWFGGSLVGLIRFQFVAQPWVPAQNPVAGTPAERMARRFADRALSIPALRDRLKNIPPVARLTAAMALAGQALVYLDDSLLLERAQLANRMYQLVDDTSCGSIVQGHPSRPQLLQAIGALDSVSQEHWVEINATAIESQYGGRTTPALVTATIFKASLNKLLARAPRDIAQRLSIALGGLDSVSRPKACWAARTLYSRVLVAPPSERRVLIRGLVQR